MTKETKDLIDIIMEEAEIQLYDNWDAGASDMGKLKDILNNHLPAQQPSKSVEELIEKREMKAIRCINIDYHNWYRDAGKEILQDLKTLQAIQPKWEVDKYKIAIHLITEYENDTEFNKFWVSNKITDFEMWLRLKNSSKDEHLTSKPTEQEKWEQPTKTD